MYGVIEIAGRQYRVSPGDIIDVNRLEHDEGSSIELESVLFIGGENPVVGLPQVAGAKVKAKVIRQARDRKIIVFKRRPGLWRKKRGHRQHYTGLLITDIDDGKGNSSTIDQESKVAKKYLESSN